MGVDWGALRRQADAQASLVTRSQCRAAGMSGRAIEWRVSSGRWCRTGVGVYLTAPGRRDWLVTATSAILSLQRDLVTADVALRGRSAAYLWGLDHQEPRLIHVAVPQRRAVLSTETVKVRRSMRWSNYVDDHADPPRTTVVATVLDIAREGSAIDALSVVAKAVQQRRVTPSQVEQEIRDRGGHRYSKLLRNALADMGDGAESGAELLYVRDVERAHGLPQGVRQLPSSLGGGRRHDNGYPAYRLIVEVDGRLGHEQWADRVRDGQRDRRVLGTTHATTRVYYSDVALNPCETALEVGLILETRGWAGRPRPCRRQSCALRDPSV